MRGSLNILFQLYLTSLTISCSVTVLDGFFSQNSSSRSASISDLLAVLLALDKVSLTFADDPNDLTDREELGGLGTYFLDNGLEVKSLVGGEVCFTFTFPDLALSWSFRVLPTDTVLSFKVAELASLYCTGPLDTSANFLCGGGGRTCLQ